jgi:hypothetical protein
MTVGNPVTSRDKFTANATISLSSTGTRFSDNHFAASIRDLGLLVVIEAFCIVLVVDLLAR